MPPKFVAQRYRNNVAAFEWVKGNPIPTLLRYKVVQQNAAPCRRVHMLPRSSCATTVQLLRGRIWNHFDQATLLCSNVTQPVRNFTTSSKRSVILIKKSTTRPAPYR